MPAVRIVFAPLLRILGDELAEVGGRAGKHDTAEDPRRHAGIDERRVDPLSSLATTPAVRD
jgi:hypothetical protein